MNPLPILAASIVTLVAATSIVALRDTAGRIAALNAQSALATTRHGAIEFADWGTGPTVLVLHGAGGGFDQGKLLAAAVGGGGFRYISVSRFGYLRSVLPDDASVSAQSEALVDLIDVLKIDRVSIIAMSGGAPPALKFAETYPERTDRIVLMSSAPFTPFSPIIEKRPLPGWAYGALLGNDVAYWILTKIARGALRRAFDARTDLLADISQGERDFVEALVDGFLPASRRMKGLANEIAAVDPNAVYNLESIKVPALVIHARDDRMNPIAIGETIARRLPGATYVEYGTGGHLLLGRHDDIRARIDGFLAQ